MLANVIQPPPFGEKSVVITDNTTTNVDVSRYSNLRVVANVIPRTYGAVWAGTSNPSWSRTDDAANFSDPNPYYAGMNGLPSSPFDGIMPWAGMRRVTDSAAGELVEIPKFYYKWTRGTSDDSMQLQISMTQQPGFYCSPAHADRGDNVGERDYVYIGRYHCTSDYTSKAGVKPLGSTTKSTFRTGIHNLGNYIWQNDYALFWTVRMLYLVEFAHWDCQSKIGMGAGTSADGDNMGYTDDMPYHTGTTVTDRTSNGGTQYRYIEGLWDNVLDIIDGIYFSSYNKYCIKNPANFSDSQNGTYVGSRANLYSDFYKNFSNENVSGYEYAIYPKTAGQGATEDTYICDIVYNNVVGTMVYSGGLYRSSVNIKTFGLFYYNSDNNASYTNAKVGSRLMALPSQRLTSAT